MKNMKNIIAGALAFVWTGYAADQLGADPLSRLANSAETQKLEATVTPTQPYVLPDGRTQILVEKQAEHGFVPGSDDESHKPGSRVQVTNDDLSVDLPPETVIASGGYRFRFGKPHDFELYNELQGGDMMVTCVKSCKCPVAVEKGKPPLVSVEALQGNLKFHCAHGSGNELKSLRGSGKYFVALKIMTAELSWHGTPSVFGPILQGYLVTNFGTKRVSLYYTKETTVTIGPGTITLQSLHFDKKAESVEVAVKASASSKVSKAEAVILEYGSAAVAPGR